MKKLLIMLVNSLKCDTFSRLWSSAIGLYAVCKALWYGTWVRWKPGIVLCSLLLAACTSAVGETAVSGDPATVGQSLYVPSCAGCHGEQGEGFISAIPAPALNSGGTLWQQTDQQIYDWIANGKLDSNDPMPAYGNQFSEDQIWAIVAYLHTLWSEEQRAAQP